VNWIWTRYPGGSGLTAAHEAPLQDQSAAAADGLKTRGPLKLMEPEGLAVSEICVPTGHGPDPALLTVTTTVKTAGLLVGCMDLSTTRSHIPAGVEVAVGEGEGVAVAAGVGVGVRVAVGEDVGVFVTVGDGVGVRVAGVGVGDGVAVDWPSSGGVGLPTATAVAGMVGLGVGVATGTRVSPGGGIGAALHAPRTPRNTSHTPKRSARAIDIGPLLSGFSGLSPHPRQTAAALEPHGSVWQNVSFAAFPSALFETVAHSCADPEERVATVWKPAA
jgi:hypothetical protein